MEKSPPALDAGQQQALLEIGQAINSILQKGPLLEKVMDIAAEAIKAERGFLVLCKEKDGPLNVEVALNMSEGLADLIARPSSSVVK